MKKPALRLRTPQLHAAAFLDHVKRDELAVVSVRELTDVRGHGDEQCGAGQRQSSTLAFLSRDHFFGAKTYIYGIQLAVTDADIVLGCGQLVEGDGVSLFLAEAGRRTAINKLSGPGRGLLRRRFADREHYLCGCTFTLSQCSAVQ